MDRKGRRKSSERKAERAQTEKYTIYQNLNPRVMERKGRRKSSERKAERAQTEKSRL